MVDEAALVAVRVNEARVNVTWAGQNGDLPDPVNVDAADGDIKTWVSEAIRGGDIPGIRADATVNLQDFVVDRFEATQDVPYARIAIRPKNAIWPANPIPIQIRLPQVVMLNSRSRALPERIR